jgi:hypothetical protein
MYASRLVLVLTLTVGLVAAPLAAAAQPGKAYRIGYLETSTMRARAWEAFRERLRELGYADGRPARSTDCPGSRPSWCASRSM